MRLRTLMLSSLLLALPTFAHATTIYTYTGSNYTLLYNNGFDPYSTSEHLQGTITMSSPLAANLQNASISPLSFSFNDGLFVISNSNAYAPYTQFHVTTDAAGYIIGDSFQLEAFIGQNTVEFWSNSASGDSAQNYQVFGCPYSCVAVTSEGTAQVAGVWTPTAPAVSSTPEPSSLILLGTGCLATLGAVRRRLRS